MKFGEWTVVERAEDRIQPKGYHMTMWHCRCSCGNERDVYANSLTTGRSTSCGCKAKETAKKTAKKNFTTHGQTNTRLYQIWAGMHKRCENCNASNYSDYGGRGISVCDEWNDFVPFHDWAMANGYTEELSIDRINVDLNYTPENCRWVGSVAQANNRRSSRYYEYNGETHTISEWSKILNIPYKKLWKHINSGKPIESIL